MMKLFRSSSKAELTSPSRSTSITQSRVDSIEKVQPRSPAKASPTSINTLRGSVAKQVADIQKVPSRAASAEVLPTSPTRGVTGAPKEPNSATAFTTDEAGRALKIEVKEVTSAKASPKAAFPPPPPKQSVTSPSVKAAAPVPASSPPPRESTSTKAKTALWPPSPPKAESEEVSKGRRALEARAAALEAKAAADKKAAVKAAEEKTVAEKEAAARREEAERAAATAEAVKKATEEKAATEKAAAEKAAAEKAQEDKAAAEKAKAAEEQAELEALMAMSETDLRALRVSTTLSADREACKQQVEATEAKCE